MKDIYPFFCVYICIVPFWPYHQLGPFIWGTLCNRCSSASRKRTSLNILLETETQTGLCNLFSWLAFKAQKLATGCWIMGMNNLQIKPYIPTTDFGYLQ